MFAKDIRDWLIGLSFVVVAGAIVYHLTMRPRQLSSGASVLDPPALASLRAERLFDSRSLFASTEKYPAPRSPVIIVGGSITPYSQSGFLPCSGTATDGGDCYESVEKVDVSTLGLDLGYAAGAWTGLTKTWTVTLNARGANATGVKVCLSQNPTGGHCDAPDSGLKPPSYVVVSMIKPGPLFYNELPDEPSLLALRYRDPNWDPTNPSYKFVEHIQSVLVTGPTYCQTSNCTFFCPDGQCNVYIGPPQ